MEWLKRIPSRVDRVVVAAMPAAGLLLPWFVAVGVKVHLQARGKPTWPWSTFTEYAIPGVIGCAIAAAPLALLAVFYREWVIGRLPWLGRVSALQRRFVVLGGFAGGLAGMVWVFVDVFWDFDPMVLVVVPLLVVTYVPWMGAGLASGVALALLAGGLGAVRGGLRRELTVRAVAKRVGLDVALLVVLYLGARLAGGHALIVAAGSSPTLARGLVALGVDVHATDASGRTALMEAAARGDAPLVRHLLDHGADVNARLHPRPAPVLDAAGGHLTINEGSALHAAAGNGRVEVVEVLLARGADANAVNALGQTPLMLGAACTASCPARTRVVRRLLEAGADPRARDAQGWTALWFVSGGKDRDEVRRLIREAGGTE